MNVRTLAAQNEAARQNTLQTLRAMNGNIPVELLAAEYPAAAEVVNDDEFYAEVMATDAGILSAEASVEAAAQEIKVNKQNWLPKFEVGYRRNTAMKEAAPCPCSPPATRPRSPRPATPPPRASSRTPACRPKPSSSPATTNCSRFTPPSRPTTCP